MEYLKEVLIIRSIVTVITLQTQKEYVYQPENDNFRSAASTTKVIETVESVISCGIYCSQEDECSSFFYDTPTSRCFLARGTLYELGDHRESSNGTVFFIQSDMVAEQCKYESCFL